MINNTKHFKSWEITYSYIAEQNNIDNTPTDETIIENLNYTLQRLEEIREGYNKPIVISSGYRCEELNELVGGEEDSYHLKGLAVDLRWDKELVEYIINNCQFHKAIREKSGKTKWLHLQFKLDRTKELNRVISINK